MNKKVSHLHKEVVAIVTNALFSFGFKGWWQIKALCGAVIAKRAPTSSEKKNVRKKKRLHLYPPAMVSPACQLKWLLAVAAVGHIACFPLRSLGPGTIGGCGLVPHFGGGVICHL